MWECFNCTFNNVDAAAICARCRARKPEPGEKPRGRSYHQVETAARERFADEVMSTRWNEAPSFEDLRAKWKTCLGDPPEIANEMAIVETRLYQVREEIKTLVNIVRNPKLRGREEQLASIIKRLQDW